ncbi:MAG TPA: hypothetical protein VJH97_07315 [Candidatus Nanoarchaeia archaeon]|nr:hypothetical protein [Candidatus Nanoarchaeia archaeon]
MSKTFVAFGFGPISAGLFLYEAYKSGRFDELVVSEVDPKTVEAVRANGGKYTFNAATLDGRVTREVEGVTILNPEEPQDVNGLFDATKRADEIVTALNNVEFYSKPTVKDPLQHGLSVNPKRVVVYTAENNINAAHLLRESLVELDQMSTATFVNTVIGKMSQRVTDPSQIREMNLTPITPGLESAFLVEEAPDILLARSQLPPGYETMLAIFQEKRDLVPFDGVKLYGHNGPHAMAAYLLALVGAKDMPQLDDRENVDIRVMAQQAMIAEAGAALCRAYKGQDPIFTQQGWRTAYAEPLIKRISNPYLADSVARVARDPARKLHPDDRLVGALKFCREHGIRQSYFATGAAAAALMLDPETGQLAQEVEVVQPHELAARLETVWKAQRQERFEGKTDVLDAIGRAYPSLCGWLQGRRPDLFKTDLGFIPYT